MKQVLIKRGKIQVEGDVKDSLADINKAIKLLVYQPKVGFEIGLEKILARNKQNDSSI